MVKKIFIGGPFKQFIDPKKNRMNEEKKHMFLQLINFFNDRGYEIHNAHIREDWGQSFWAPDQCTKLDYDEIASSDVFLAFPGVPASPGTHIEIGWASALGKQVILLLEKGAYYAHLVKGLHTVGNVHYLEYEEPADYMIELAKMFPAKDLARV